MTQQYIVNGVEFKVGDKVRVERQIASNAADGMGSAGRWSNSWASRMDAEVGKEFTIARIESSGAYFNNDSTHCGWPLTALTNLSALLKAGDVVRCTSISRMFISYGKEYTVREDQRNATAEVAIYDNDGDASSYTRDNFELVSRAATTTTAKPAIKVGDKVKVVRDDNCSYITNGEVFTVQDIRGRDGKINLNNGGGSSHYYEADRFELTTEAAPKLKLPLSAKRLLGSGRDIVLVPGTVAGKVTMIYVSDGETAVDYDTEEAIIRKFANGTWTVNGGIDPLLAKNVEDAKAAVAAAEAALAEAEAALANQKPYLV